MDDRRTINTSQLNVILETAEFAKEFYYFITVNLDGESEKRRTDISERVNSPVFLAKTFFLPLPNNRIELNMRLIFQVFVVTVKEGEVKEKGQARLLGDCTLELGPLAPVLTDIRGAGTRQHLKFTRNHEGQVVTVGRFLVTLRLIPQQSVPIETVGNMDIFHPLPAVDPFKEFLWRVRVDFRAANDVPSNSMSASGLPSPYMEFGWSHYVQQKPGDNETEKSIIIPNSRHPIWNYQLFYYNNDNVTQLDGFFWSTLKDRVASESIETVCMPVSAMRSFHPVHLNILTTRGGGEESPRCELYFSFVIEEAINTTTSFVEELIDIAILGINWSPDPTSISKIMIGMTTHGFQLTDLPLTTIDITEETNISRELSRHRSQRHSIFLSPVLPIGMTSLDNDYGAQCIFTVPKSFINNQISFYLIARDENLVGKVKHQLPNVVVAYTEILDDHLKSSLQ